VRREPERVGEAVVLLQAVRLERRVRGLDHLHRAAGVDLVTREVGEIGQDRLVDEAGAPGPVVLRLRCGEHRHEGEVRVLGRPLPRQVGQVEIGERAHAPVQDHLALHADVERVLDHALHRREAGRAGDEDDRLVGILAQEERAERALEAHDVADLHVGEHVGGEPAARDVADLQLDAVGLVRRRGEGEAAMVAVGQDDVDVLPGVIADAAAALHRQLHDHHVVRGLLHRDDLGGVDRRPEAARQRLRHVLDLDVGERRGAAGEDQALLALGGAERRILVRPLLDRAVAHRALALAAAAVPALVREGDARAQHGVENGLPGPHRDDPVVRVDEQVAVLLRGALGRQPRQREQEQGQRADERPHRAGRPLVDQRIDRQVEPVERDHVGRRREVGGRGRDRGLDEREHEKRQRQPDPHRARRRGLRARHALGVDPQQREHAQRQADVQERQQREEAIVDRLGRDEVADQRPVEHRQPVEPFGGRHADELRGAVPRQHVAVDAADVGEPEQDDARHPGEPAEAAVVVEHVVAHQVQRHRQHHRVRGVAMEAAHHPAQPPLLARQALDRRVGLVDAGPEEDVKVEPAADDHPQQEVGDRAEVVERIELVAEHPVEQALDGEEQRLPRAVDDSQHCRGRGAASVWIGAIVAGRKKKPGNERRHASKPGRESGMGKC
jgi:hypothetical protein